MNNIEKLRNIYKNINYFENNLLINFVKKDDIIDNLFNEFFNIKYENNSLFSEIFSGIELYNFSMIYENKYADELICDE